MTVESPPAPPTSPPVRRGPLRGILIGVGLGLIFVIVAALVFAVTRPAEREVDYLSPDSGSPVGARALVAVLRDQGVDVETPTTLAGVRALDTVPSETTLVLFDYYAVLGPDQRRELLAIADHVVVMEPVDAELDDLAPGVVLGVAPDAFGTAYAADCELPAAVRARTIDAFPMSYDVSEAENAVEGCFATADDEFAVVQTETRGTDVTVVGVTRVFTNGGILAEGNASFALNLLGDHETLVWYRPDLSEVDAGEVPTAVSRTAPWLTPLILLLAAVGFAAAIWRGRRFGPLVTERLPVVVRSNETMEGRARLYERAGAREHALDSLRIGTVDRLARLCGLPRRATVDEVVTAVAALLARDRAAVEALLVGRPPTSDAQLVALSDDLLVLEADVTRAARGR